MKKSSFSLAAIATGALVLSFSLAVHAQIPPDAAPAMVPPPPRDSLRQRIQQNYQAYTDNVRNNEDYRNMILERRAGNSSTTPPLHPEWPVGSSTWREGTSTHPFPPQMMRGSMASSTMSGSHERFEKVRRDMFNRMRDHLVEQLDRALDNLRQIRARISSRIDLETKNGKDMSSAISLLTAADAKITAAGSEIKILAAFVPATSTDSGSASASTTIDLAKPRSIGADAIKAVNSVREALRDVVRAISKVIGDQN